MWVLLANQSALYQPNYASFKFFYDIDQSIHPYLDSIEISSYNSNLLFRSKGYPRGGQEYEEVRSICLLLRRERNRGGHPARGRPVALHLLRQRGWGRAQICRILTSVLITFCSVSFILFRQRYRSQCTHRDSVLMKHVNRSRGIPILQKARSFI